MSTNDRPFFGETEHARAAARGDCRGKRDRAHAAGPHGGGQDVLHGIRALGGQPGGEPTGAKR